MFVIFLDDLWRVGTHLISFLVVGLPKPMETTGPTGNQGQSPPTFSCRSLHLLPFSADRPKMSNSHGKDDYINSSHPQFLCGQNTTNRRSEFVASTRQGKGRPFITLESCERLAFVPRSEQTIKKISLLGGGRTPPSRRENCWPVVCHGC